MDRKEKQLNMGAMSKRVLRIINKHSRKSDKGIVIEAKKDRTSRAIIKAKVYKAKEYFITKELKKKRRNQREI